MRHLNYDDYRLIGIPFKSQLIRETRLLHNHAYIYTNQYRLVIIILAELVLALNCIIGDFYIFHTNDFIDIIRSTLGLSERFVRAIMDNGSHFTIAAISWFILIFSSSVIARIIIR